MHDSYSPVAERPATGWGRTFESFKVPQFRLFWAAMMTQMGAQNMQLVARSWLVYELTGQYTMLGLVALANAIPMVGFSLFGGALADRVQKKNILIAGKAASALVALGIASLLTMDVISLERHTGVGFLLAASAVQGIVMGLMIPAQQAIIPEIVGQRRLMNAVALNAAGQNVNRLLAPGVAGLLIAIAGIQTVFFTMTALHILGAALIVMLLPSGTIALGRRGTLGDVVEGLRYVRGHTVIVGLLLITLFSVVLSMPYMFLMPAFAKDIQVVGAGEYAWLARIPLLGALMADVPELLTESSFRLGLLTSIAGIGALVGSLFIAAMGSRNRGSTFLWSIVVLGGGLAAYAFTSSFALALLLMIVVGLGQAARMALSNALVQDAVDDEHRGRVMSIYMMEFGLSSFATYVVAVLANVTGIQWALGGAALLLVPLALFYIVFVPSIRRLQ